MILNNRSFPDWILEQGLRRRKLSSGQFQDAGSFCILETGSGVDVFLIHLPEKSSHPCVPSENAILPNDQMTRRIKA